MTANVDPLNIVVDHEEITTILPHRYPFLLVDRVCIWILKRAISSVKKI